MPIDGGITAPTGFKSSAVHCGIKAKAGALDLVVLAVDTFASVAGIFTTNLAQAAPVLVSKRHLDVARGTARAIVVNSGCANACTGEEGLANATRMAEKVARALGCPSEQVLVASTGVIGVGLNMDASCRHPRSVCLAGPRQRQRCSARHHDDRPVSEGTRRARDDAARGVFRRRHGQGLRDDRAEHGDDARLHHDRCPGNAARCCSARSSNRRATHSTRSRWTASAPPTTACSRWLPASSGCRSTSELYPALLDGAADRVARSSRSGSSAAAKARRR